MKHLLHIDMDAFFASVEQVKNPSLKDKPFIVCWIGKHSIVSSPNYVARTYGIRAAMPIHTAQNLCKNLILVPIDFKAYQQFHDRFVDIIKSNYSKIIEVSSIDECYIDITHLVKNKIEAIALAKTIQDKIYDELKITCSIGVSNNKFLAKMGSDLRKPFGISPIYKTNIKDKLWPLPISKMYMIGDSTAPVLIQQGIKTIGDLAKKKNILILKQFFSKNWQWYYDNVNGNGNDEIDIFYHAPKSISSGTTFLENTSDINEIKQILIEHTKKVVYQLQKEDLGARTFGVSIKLNKDIQNEKIISLRKRLYVYDEIFPYIMKIYQDNFINKTIRSIKVKLTGFENEIVIDNPVQLNFFID